MQPTFKQQYKHTANKQNNVQNACRHNTKTMHTTQTHNTKQQYKNYTHLTQTQSKHIHTINNNASTHFQNNQCKQLKPYNTQSMPYTRSACTNKANTHIKQKAHKTFTNTIETNANTNQES